MNIKIHPDYQCYAAAIVAVPATFDTAGHLLHAGRNVIRRITVGGVEMVVKRFKRPNLVQRVAYTLFEASKAVRAYRNGLELLRRGVSTPQPIAYIEVRRGGWLSDCYYICGVDDAPSIACLNEVADFDRPLAADFARFAARLHEKGILHDDLNSTNVLWRTDKNNGRHFSVIDINRMRFCPARRIPPMSECRENLTRFTGRMDLFEFVASAYLRARGLPDRQLPSLLATKRRHDRRWRRRKRFLRRLRRWFGSRK